MFTSSKMSVSTASAPKFMTTTMKEKTAERNGSRRIIINPKKKSPPKDELVLPGGHEFPYTTGGFYVGEWARDKKEGFGTQTWTNGNKYEGEWVRNRRHGRGKLIYADGRVYEGDFAEDERYGLPACAPRRLLLVYRTRLSH